MKVLFKPWDQRRKKVSVQAIGSSVLAEKPASREQAMAVRRFGPLWWQSGILSCLLLSIATAVSGPGAAGGGASAASSGTISGTAGGRAAVAPRQTWEYPAVANSTRGTPVPNNQVPVPGANQSTGPAGVNSQMNNQNGVSPETSGQPGAVQQGTMQPGAAQPGAAIQSGTAVPENPNVQPSLNQSVQGQFQQATPNALNPPAINQYPMSSNAYSTNNTVGYPRWATNSGPYGGNGYTYPPSPNPAVHANGSPQ